MTATDPSPSNTFDLVVAGSGAAGLATAISAASRGLSVLVLEKAREFGGTTSSSAGVVWIPANYHAQEVGISDSPDKALQYLKAMGGDRVDPVKARIFVEEARDVLAWFESNTAARFELSPAWPDYHPEAPGASSGGRSLGPAPFDGRILGKDFDRLKPPLATTMILGGMMVAREDLPSYYMMLRSPKAFLTVASRFGRYIRDRVSGYSRGTRLSNGNALIGMLAYTAIDHGVEILTETPLTGFEADSQGGYRIRAGQRGQEMLVRSRKGLVLAGGGFPANKARARRHFPHLSGREHSHRSLAPDSNTGDTLSIAIDLGARLVTDRLHPAAWTPVSLVPQKDGTTLPFPHFFDRGKAGYIAVTREGKRFTNEARSYHDFVPAMIKACAQNDDTECFLICDHAAIRRYGLGVSPPAPGRLGPHLRSGYIQRGDSLAELATHCGIDPSGLTETVSAFNADAAAGRDPEFAKGGDCYQRFNGSAGHVPNPCLAPLTRPPYYAVRIIPGDLGTFVGLDADEESRVLAEDGTPIAGLYAVGNDAASFMGGAYPGAGITNGPALVFGYRLGVHIASGAGPSAEPASLSKHESHG